MLGVVAGGADEVFVSVQSPVDSSRIWIYRLNGSALERVLDPGACTATVTASPGHVLLQRSCSGVVDYSRWSGSGWTAISGLPSWAADRAVQGTAGAIIHSAHHVLLVEDGVVREISRVGPARVVPGSTLSSAWGISSDQQLMTFDGSSWAVLDVTAAIAVDSAWRASDGTVFMSHAPDADTVHVERLRDGSLERVTATPWAPSVSFMTGRSADDVYVLTWRQLQHWDGTAWSVPGGALPSPCLFLFDLAPAGRDGLVSTYCGHGLSGDGPQLSIFDGTTWSTSVPEAGTFLGVSTVGDPAAPLAVLVDAPTAGATPYHVFDGTTWVDGAFATGMGVRAVGGPDLDHVVASADHPDGRSGLAWLDHTGTWRFTSSWMLGDAHATATDGTTSALGTAVLSSAGETGVFRCSLEL